MNGLLLNIVLALLWMALSGEFTAQSLLLGGVLSFVVLLLTQRIIGAPAYARKVLQVISLILYFIWELLLANLRVAYDVLTPGFHMKPGVVAVPLDVRTDAEITLLANLITLTPGTLSLDVSADRSVLYLHALFIDSPDEVRRQIKQGFERRVLEVLR